MGDNQPLPTRSRQISAPPRRDAYLVPAYASWFGLNRLHEYERSFVTQLCVGEGLDVTMKARELRRGAA